MDKPIGILDTILLCELKEHPQDDSLWQVIQAIHKADSSDIHIDERSGEIICELFGPLIDWK